MAGANAASRMACLAYPASPNARESALANLDPAVTFPLGDVEARPDGA